MQRQIACLVLFVSVAAAPSASAQEVTNMPVGSDQSIGLEAGLESAFMVRPSYAHRVPDFLRDTLIYARFTWPIVTPDLGDFAFDAGLRTTALGGESWKLELLLGPVLRNTSNELFSATAVGLRSALFAGYKSDGWGLMAELGYEQILATHLRHSDVYRQTSYAGARDGWYSITGGTWQAGLRGGARIGQVELYSTLGAMATGRLEPIVPPFYMTIGSAYAF